MWRLAFFIPVWGFWYVLVELPLMIIGFFLIAWFALNHDIVDRASQVYQDQRQITGWRAGWMYLWGNEEDGLDGLPWIKGPNGAQVVDPRQQWWLDDTHEWSLTRRIFVWSAWRNSVSNLRFTRAGLQIDPSRVYVRFFGPTPHDSWLCWQGWRGRIHWETKRGVLEVGWKVRPDDRFGLVGTDSRMPGTGFGARWKKRA